MEKISTVITQKSASDTEQVLETAPHKTAAVWPPTTRHEIYPS